MLVVRCGPRLRVRSKRRWIYLEVSRMTADFLQRHGTIRRVRSVLLAVATHKNRSHTGSVAFLTGLQRLRLLM